MPRRASGSSSAMTARILFNGLSPHGKTYGRNRAAAFGVEHVESGGVAEQRFQPRSRISESDSDGGFSKISGTVIPHAQYELAVRFLSHYLDQTCFAALRHAMTNGILHQWLQNELRHQCITNVRLD